MSRVMCPVSTTDTHDNWGPGRPARVALLPLHMMFELAMKLMSIPSLTGGEKEIGLFLSELLFERRYRVEKQFLIPNRFNVLAFAGRPRVVLCTHIDTVPPVLPMRETETHLYGRGAC